VCTANANNLPFAKYLELLRPGCKFVLVGVPEAPLPSVRGVISFLYPELTSI